MKLSTNKEIAEAAKDKYGYGTTYWHGVKMDAFREGAKWMREQVEKFSSNSMLADSAVFTKEQVVRIVAEFGKSYNTEAFLGNGETLEEAIEEVKDLIKWDA